MRKKVLIGCEYSGVIRDEFSKMGWDAWSCDLLPTESEMTQAEEKHYQCDIFDVLYQDWDLFIANPPCTHLAVSGARHFKNKQDGRQQEALYFVEKLLGCGINHIAIENPVSIISTHIRKPDQIIQPYYFGDEFQKTTCLWLKNLPKLIHISEPDLFNPNPTHCGKGEFIVFPSGKRMAKWYSQLPSSNKNNNALIRSKTFPGIARAMAAQWTEYILSL
jgi:hypothetical protein